MKICFIGKYPPIEGGVSTRNYWTIYGLAQRGHEIYVVTNAGEVEPRYRLDLSADDRLRCEPRFDPGFVRVFSSGVLEANLAYIPTANPFVSKLSSIATRVVRESACDVIVASYFEPYGVAGFLTSRFTNVPLVLSHAGSDLGRLMRLPELATTYKEILKGADCVLTPSRFRERFVGFGVHPERVAIDPPFAIPTDVFSPAAAPLTAIPGDYNVGRRVDANGAPIALADALSVPCVGIYGKVGRSKGTFDLVAALGKLARDDVAFNFLAMTNGDDAVFARFKSELAAANLADRTYVLPFVPNWRVPNFIRTCTAVCFLERDFPIPSHRPIVAREILACGVPLVLSGEIAKKQAFRNALEDGEWAFVVNDPKDHAELSTVLRTIFSDEARRTRVGANGRLVSQKTEDARGFIDDWVEVLCAVIGGRTSGSLRLATSPVSTTVRDLLVESLPGLPSILGAAFEGLVAKFDDTADARAHGDRRIAARFLDFLVNEHAATLRELGALKEEAAKYLQISLRMSGEGHAREVPFWDADGHRAQPLSASVARQLRPMVNPAVVIETFSEAALKVARNAAGDCADANAAPRQTNILFHRTPNLERCELRIDHATRSLLELCDGTRVTEDIAGRFAAPGDPDVAYARTFAALERLESLGVVGFR